ncbi:MAG: 4-hydroxybenzoate polyprenyltransferase [Bacteroidia bacterium]
MFTIIAILLLWYSHYLKGLPLVGNILVSLIAGYSILVVYQFFSVQTPSLVYAYAGFAFLFTLLRELVKDIQDAEGDQEVGYFTLPVRIGTTRSLSVFKGLLIFTLVAFVQIQIELVQTYFQAPLQWIFIAYLLICVVAPMFYVLYLVVVKPKEVDFSELSWMIKYILATGILSMMFY